jgi:adenine-specific DNA-methyltransferase
VRERADGCGFVAGRLAKVLGLSAPRSRDSRQNINREKVPPLSAIDDLIAQIHEPRLREQLKREWAEAQKTKKFGLVFHRHLPELVPIPKAKPRRGDLVARKGGSLTDLWRVRRVIGGMAHCVRPEGTPGAGEPWDLELDELVVVRRFGEPIFPALIPMDQVQNGPADAPWHCLIEADNFHALQLLGYLYAGKVDCIYIDPPYNTGARDWKYNNDYVDANDTWRHSKWLSFMEKRLQLAKRLLRPDDSVLLITIDDNELCSLGLLLDELFPGCERQVVSITISPRGKSREGRFSQVDEYLLVLYFGAAGVARLGGDGDDREVRWRYLRRNDIESARPTRPNQFYPIYVDPSQLKIVGIGKPLRPDESLSAAPRLRDTITVFPVREDGVHMNWGITGPSLQRALENGYVRVTAGSHPNQPFTFAYLTAPNIKKVENGTYEIVGDRPDGSKIVVIPGGRRALPTTVWREARHDAGAYGTGLIRTMLPGRKFPFPKSLYTVEDSLRLFVEDKPNAIVVDFFAGSGTTLHALMRLNALNEGGRQCILVTNNEVSGEEADSLRSRGLLPGDEDWDQQGICRSVTWPRAKFSILGRTDAGAALPGEYFGGRTVKKEKSRKVVQIGFVDPGALNRPAKKQLLALIDGLPQTLVTDPCPFIVSEDHKASVLFDESAAEDWLAALDGQSHITDLYIVTPDKKRFDILKAEVHELLGPILVPEEEKCPLADGFPANLAYFKLDFLDKDRVALKRAFREILPLLWLKAGAIGPRPELPRGEEPAFFAPPANPFAVLLDEGRLKALLAALDDRPGLRCLFIVTDSEDAFKDLSAEAMAALRAGSPDLETIQLYRDYLENFVINIGEVG